MKSETWYAVLEHIRAIDNLLAADDFAAFQEWNTATSPFIVAYYKDAEGK